MYQTISRYFYKYEMTFYSCAGSYLYHYFLLPVWDLQYYSDKLPLVQNNQEL